MIDRWKLDQPRPPVWFLRLINKWSQSIYLRSTYQFLFIYFFKIKNSKTGFNLYFFFVFLKEEDNFMYDDGITKKKSFCLILMLNKRYVTYLPIFGLEKQITDRIKSAKRRYIRVKLNNKKKRRSCEAPSVFYIQFFLNSFPYYLVNMSYMGCCVNNGILNFFFIYFISFFWYRYLVDYILMLYEFDVRINFIILKRTYTQKI